MFIANTNIVVGRKTYQKGQAVTGLPSFDRQWMLTAGYIAERSDPAEKKDRKARKLDITPAEPQTESQVENEFQGSVSG